ncbi:hypothetical protein [Streptomyces sp. NPDC058989]|uniref:hypothetical protein n=1 Tax=Streptomyces sp. NPDC058989 TaxID=3346686 RepID=UPI00369E08FF
MLTKRHVATVLTAVMAAGCVSVGSAWAAKPSPTTSNRSSHYAEANRTCQVPEQQNGSTGLLGHIVTGGVIGDTIDRAHLCRIDLTLLDNAEPAPHTGGAV